MKRCIVPKRKMGTLIFFARQILDAQGARGLAREIERERQKVDTAKR
jgi:hypothetical protein